MLEEGWIHATTDGTPQGGVISPLLANVALHGMETALIEYFGWTKGKRNRPLLVRYADDFVVLMDTEQDVTRARLFLGVWLRGMGLTLHPDKTRIRHTLDPVEGQSAGFDFLGFTVRHFRVSAAHSPRNPHGKRMGAKCIIKPSKEAIRRHLRRIREIIHRYGTAPQDQMIETLNPIIRGWARYHRTVVARKSFEGCDHVLFSRLRRWAWRRHAHRGWKKIVRKYWEVELGRWRFTSPDGSALQSHTTVKIRRHVKVRGDASPYDGNLTYWAQRLSDHPLVNSRLATVLRWQKGRCGFCGLAFKPDDLIELDHLIPRVLGGRDVVTNLQALHRHCHDQKTAGDGSRAARRKGIDDNDYSTEEPDEGKRSCPVLEWRRAGRLARRP